MICLGEILADAINATALIEMKRSATERARIRKSTSVILNVCAELEARRATGPRARIRAFRLSWPAQIQMPPLAIKAVAPLYPLRAVTAIHRETSLSRESAKAARRRPRWNAQRARWLSASDSIAAHRPR
jgi:hypothetical protein